VFRTCFPSTLPKLLTSRSVLSSPTPNNLLDSELRTSFVVEPFFWGHSGPGTRPNGTWRNRATREVLKVCDHGPSRQTGTRMTDDFGFRATEDAVQVHDLHATMLTLLGIDHEKRICLFKGRNRRLPDVGGDNHIAARLTRSIAVGPKRLSTPELVTQSDAPPRVRLDGSDDTAAGLFR